MRNLYIFGDSFGEEKPLGYPENHPLHHEVMALTSYHDLIRQSKVFDRVISYAEGGSNLWKQYLLLKKHLATIAPHDVVIWFETHPGRLVSKCGKNLPNFNSVERLLAEARNSSKSIPNREHVIRICQAAKDYFLLLQRPEYDHFAHDAIKKAAHDLRPDIYWIPCFPMEHLGQSIKKVLAYAYSIENQEFSKYINMSDHYDLRRNHMIQRNHELFAVNLLEHILYNTPLRFDQFVKPNKKDCNIYFRPKK